MFYMNVLAKVHHGRIYMYINTNISIKRRIDDSVLQNTDDINLFCPWSGTIFLSFICHMMANNTRKLRRRLQKRATSKRAIQ